MPPKATPQSVPLKDVEAALPRPLPQAPRPLPLPLPLPVTLSQWHGNETNPVRLRALMADPVIQSALALLLERARPTQRGVADPNANATSLLGWYAGYCDAIHDLRHTLTSPALAAGHSPGSSSLVPSPAGHTYGGADTDEPWGYILPDDLIPSDGAN